MKSSRINYGLLVGLIVSIFLHLGIIFAIFYINSTRPTSIKSFKNAPVKLSLSMFENREVEMIEDKPKIEPKSASKAKKIVVPKKKPEVVKKETVKKSKILEEQKNIKEEQELVSKDDVAQIEQKEKPEEASADNSEIYALMQKALYKYSKYPTLAESMGLKGETTVKFTINEEGEVLNAHTLKSSGHDILDKNIIEAVYSASKEFPKLNKKEIFTFIIYYGTQK